MTFEVVYCPTIQKWKVMCTEASGKDGSAGKERCLAHCPKYADGFTLAERLQRRN